MKGTIMYKEDILWEDWWEAIKKENPCAQPLMFKQWNGLTMDEISRIPMDYRENRIWEGWVCWALKKFGEKLSSKLRIGFINKIITPMEAFILYLDMGDLSDEEDLLLEAKFKGKLPRAEEELATGVVSRVKGS